MDSIDEAAQREIYHAKERLRLTDRPELSWRISWLAGYCAAAFLALLLLRWTIRAYLNVWHG